MKNFKFILSIVILFFSATITESMASTLPLPYGGSTIGANKKDHCTFNIRARALRLASDGSTEPSQPSLFVIVNNSIVVANQQIMPGRSVSLSLGLDDSRNGTFASINVNDVTVSVNGNLVCGPTASCQVTFFTIGGCSFVVN
jgi:hypothetical protein